MNLANLAERLDDVDFFKNHPNVADTDDEADLTAQETGLHNAIQEEKKRYQDALDERARLDKIFEDFSWSTDEDLA